jgi:hypothetical protein
MFIPDPDLDYFPIPDPRSRGQKDTGIPDPDPQHCRYLVKNKQIQPITYKKEANLETRLKTRTATLPASTRERGSTLK